MTHPFLGWSRYLLPSRSVAGTVVLGGLLLTQHRPQQLLEALSNGHPVLPATGPSLPVTFPRARAGQIIPLLGNAP